MSRLAFLAALTVLVSYISAARAESEEPRCAVLEIVGTQPLDGQVDVPIDVRPRIFFRGSERCDQDFDNPRVTLHTSADAPPITLGASVRRGNVQELLVPRMLLPDQSYTITIEGKRFENETGGSSQGNPVQKIQLKTGSRQVTRIQAPPVLEIDSLTFDEDSELENGDVRYLASYRFTPSLADDDGLSLAVVLREDDAVMEASSIGAAPITSTFELWAAPGLRLCLRGMQVDGAGNEQTAAAVCTQSVVDPATEGCAVGGARAGKASGAWVMVGLLFAARRLRRLTARARIPRRR